VSERALRIAALASIPRPGAALSRPAQSDARTRVEASAERSAEVFLYGVVGWDIWVEDLVPELAALDVDEITCHVNSPGGDAFDGIALANTLAAHKAKVTMHIEGMAASAASVIAMAGDEIVMHPGSRLMCHDALCLAVGNAEDHRAAAELLDAVSQDIAGLYAARSGGTPDEWRQKMLAETWLSADESVACGLADRVITRDREDTPALTPAAHAWSELVAQWRDEDNTDGNVAPENAGPGADTRCAEPRQTADGRAPQLPAATTDAPVPAPSGPETSAVEADAPPPAELPTAVVNLSELICSAVREGVTL
jgi:ATP-dependent protease ClpP protease subunit